MGKLLFFGDLYYDYDIVKPDIINISKWVNKNNYSSFGNLEGALTYCNEKIVKRGPNLKGTTRTLDVCEQLNVKGLFLANNHIMDFGANGLMETIKHLQNIDVTYCGAGINLFEAVKPIIFDCDSTKVAFLNFGWDVEETVYAKENSAGCAPLDRNLILSSVRKLHNEVDFVVVSLHWGFEYNRLPMPRDISLAHDIIDAGADLIIGHHPHCVQPVEIYKGKHIYYSLGNFYFGSVRKEYNVSFNESIKNQSDYGLLVAIDPKKYEIEINTIYYDKEKDSSVILEANDCLECLTNIDYQSLKYYLQTIRRKKNINPILNNSYADHLKIKILGDFYMFKSFLKKIIRRS